MNRFSQLLIIALLAQIQIMAGADKPNVLLIFPDDVGRDAINSWGGELNKTPEIDKLVESGMRFDHFYTGPVCHPSRIALVSGQYPWDIDSEKWGTFSESHEHNTIAHLLRKSGYATAAAGKWQLSRLHEDPRKPHRMGFDEYCFFGWKEGPRYWDPHIWENGELQPRPGREVYGPDIYSDFIVDFIKRQAANDTPFFAWYSMALCHGINVPHPPDPYAPGKKRYETFEEMMVELDRKVGKVLAVLDEANIRENTMVIFVSDNGTPRSLKVRNTGKRKYESYEVYTQWKGHRFRGGKDSYTDWGVRAPAAISWPGKIKPGTRTSALCELTDLFPTIAELCGANTDNFETRGRNFAPLLFGKEPENPRKWVCLPGRLHEFGVRTKDWKLTPDQKLFDMRNDPVIEKPVTAGQADKESNAARKLLQAAAREIYPNSASPNLLLNSGFENKAKDASLPVAWKLDRGTVIVGEDGGRNGKRYLRVKDNGNEDAHLLISRPISVRPGGTYTASAYIRSSDKGAPGIYLAFYAASGAKISNEYVKGKTPSEDWQKIKITRQAPPNAAKVAVWIYSFAGDIGTFDFDDAALTVSGGEEPHDAPKITATKSTPVNIGTRRELFVDRFLIDGAHRVDLEIHHPHDEGKVLAFDRPWEGQFCGYVTLLTVGDTYRAYYRGRPGVGADGDLTESTCVAESKDGITWSRPELGIHEIDGNKNNNVVLYRQAPYSHNFSPFVDTNPDVDPKEKFKAIGGTHPEGLALFVSADGYRWKLKQKKILTSEAFAFDSQACAFWSETEKKYVCYFRTWTDKKVRWVSRVTSDDCLNWSAHIEMKSDRPAEHFYTNQTHPYFRAPHLYLSLPARFVPQRQVISNEEAEEIGVNPKYFKDTSDAILVTSRPERPDHFDRSFLSSFIRPGIGAQNWVSRTNYPALNVIQTGENEMSIFTNQNYAQPTAHLRRYSMRLDGFGSMRADYDGGEVLTKPLIFSGKQLSLNFATSAAGEIKIEIQDANGKPVPGFTLAECREVIGNEISRNVTWESTAKLSDLAGKPVRLRIVMKDADLYALQFQK
ncbi:MAG: sulfatase-like hydrolase/transferase [Verrucomicrobiales bacterium]|nr:sulfatase-like hydrolase/transferase [Verrucomicrobiales bacterium]